MLPRNSTLPARALLAACALGLCPALASAQMELRPIDQGFDDTNPLAVGRRLAPTDMRASGAFERVFRVMNSGRDSGSFARVQGGLVAVFPQSQYAQTKNGAVPVIPAGTVFHIGAPKLPVSPGAPGSVGRRAAPARPGIERPSTKASARDAVPLSPARPDGPAAPIPLSIFSDETYRSRLVASLLDRALGQGP